MLGASVFGAAAQAEGYSQFNLAGVTVYDPAELLGFAATAAVSQGGPVTAEDLAETVKTIYHNDGYFLAEVFVADDGQTLVVDEGEIADVRIEGMDERTYRLVRGYMQPVVGKRAVNLKEFERAIMLVEDLEHVSATAEVIYEPGAAHASVRVVATEEDLSFGSLTLDTPAREPDEAVALTLEQTLLDTNAPGDLLRLTVAATRDMQVSGDSLWGSLAYRTPVGGAGGFVEGYLGNVTARRDASGSLLASSLEGDTAILALGYPFLRNVQAFGYGIAELRQSGNSVETGTGSSDNRVDVVSASWIHGRALAGGGAVEYALSASYGRQTGGTVTGDETFSHLRFGAGVEAPASWLGEGGSVRAELYGQYSADDLPPIEKFYIGGQNEDRGYAFAEAEGDSGVSATLELSREFHPAGSFVRYLRPFSFVDAGWVRNNDPSTPDASSATFAAIGVGIDASVAGDLLIRSFVAVPLRDGPTTASGDPSLSFSLTKNW